MGGTQRILWVSILFRIVTGADLWAAMDRCRGPVKEKKNAAAGWVWARCYEFFFERHQFLQRFWSVVTKNSRTLGPNRKTFEVPSLEEMKNAVAGTCELAGGLRRLVRQRCLG